MSMGPLATVEDVVLEPCRSGGTSTKHVASLGMSKATHEWWDSAEWWERILGELLPNAQFPDAVVRRTIACLWRFTLLRRIEDHPTLCGKILSVS